MHSSPSRAEYYARKGAGWTPITGEAVEKASLDPPLKPEEGGSGVEAFVTMVISDDFAIGAEVMLHSLRKHALTRRRLVVMITAGVSQTTRSALKAAADDVIEVRCDGSGWIWGSVRCATCFCRLDGICICMPACMPRRVRLI